MPHKVLQLPFLFLRMFLPLRKEDQPRLLFIERPCEEGGHEEESQGFSAHGQHHSPSHGIGAILDPPAQLGHPS